MHQIGWVHMTISRLALATATHGLQKEIVGTTYQQALGSLELLREVVLSQLPESQARQVHLLDGGLQLPVMKSTNTCVTC